MSAPKFDFTDRAAPIVQFGRPMRPTGDARWQRARWGEGLWGKADWEPLIWTDLACEIHEIRTNTGRGSASDRFVPGTASIVASNVHNLAEMIFPRAPGAAWESEYVPQPPIQREEELSTPDAGTLISNGWSFVDDFHRVGPRWVFPEIYATTGVAPVSPFRMVEGAFEPQMYYDSTLQHYVGQSYAQWTHGYDPTGLSEINVAIDNIDWPYTPTAGTPEVIVELLVRMNTTDKSCLGAKIRFVPVFGGANQIYYRIFQRNATGTDTPSGWAGPVSTGTGTNGMFGAFTAHAFLYGGSDETPLSLYLSVDNAAGSSVIGSVSATFSTPPTGTRVGFGVWYSQGRRPTTGGTPAFPGAPRIIEVWGEDFDDDMTRPLGPGWRTNLRDWGNMVAIDGAMVPEQVFVDQYGGNYRAFGNAQFTTSFDGDQVIDIQIEGMSVPELVTPTSTFGDTTIELWCHGNPRDAAAMGAWIQYDVRTDASLIHYELFRYGPFEEWHNLVPMETIDLGLTDGVYPEPERWRLESDLDGALRLYRNSQLLMETIVENPETGGRIGLYMDWERPDPNFTSDPVRRGYGTRITELAGGLREPLGTEELGIWIRIGVSHATLGNQWFLRGCVDGLAPTYVPDRPDAIRIECIDTLGEAGRVRILDHTLPHEFAPAPTRIHQVLNHAHWPRNLCIIRDDSTLMSRPASGKAIDALTSIAESCGGAIYSDPRNGNIVFKGQDWQGEVAAGPAMAVIGNFYPNDPPIDAPRVCPVEWEMSSRRADMNTRVRFSSESSDTEDRDPLVREWRAPNAESIYGVELHERTLLCITSERLNELARRQLRLRHPNQFPRIEAVTLDAATADEALDLMATANWMIPSKYRCQLRRGGEWIFNRSHLVTGIQHTMSAERWTCRLALDIASAFAETGARWGVARWQRDVWGRSR